MGNPDLFEGKIQLARRITDYLKKHCVKCTPAAVTITLEQSGVGDGLLCRCPALSAAHNTAIFRTPDSRTPAHRLMHGMGLTVQIKGMLAMFRVDIIAIRTCEIWGAGAPKGICTEGSCLNKICSLGQARTVCRGLGLG